MLGRLRIRMVAFVVLLGFLAGAAAGHAFEFPAEDTCVIVAMSHHMAGEKSADCGSTASHDDGCLTHVGCAFYIAPDIFAGWFQPTVTGGIVPPATFMAGQAPPPDTPPPIAFV
ncbi:hypothetical protein [Martelella endophytica]|uniref:Uncharacterized protein n=1 Tax=Martelella endophytica TaxID=1486262 RepID=A0A0D5LRQ4_MAREN|nr:hypothetical protein [Martelella endophytica]AJY46831.1 hypothetical protein TM49_15980 [Martelella endophytica]